MGFWMRDGRVFGGISLLHHFELDVSGGALYTSIPKVICLREDGPCAENGTQQERHDKDLLHHNALPRLVIDS